VPKAEGKKSSKTDISETNRPSKKKKEKSNLGAVKLIQPDELLDKSETLVTSQQQGQNKGKDSKQGKLKRKGKGKVIAGNVVDLTIVENATVEANVDTGNRKRKSNSGMCI
jgi:hypothetical protein